jgi:Ca2+-transporting ATPase
MKRKVSFENLSGLLKKSTGLDEIEYSQQRDKFGPNEIVERSVNPWIELLIDTIKDPMVWFLIGIATIFYFIGDHQEAMILYASSIPLIFMDAFLHWRTQASTSGLRSQLSSKVMVVRNGKSIEVDSLDIVPGDLVVVSTENYFLPADGFWEDTDSLQIDESVLTGEAFPVIKSSIQLDPFTKAGKAIVDDKVLGFAGTRVLTGRGYLRVLSTGKNTSYGEIVQSVAKVTNERTPLQTSILNLTSYLIYAALVFCLGLAAIRYYQGYGWLDALLSAAVLAVAAIPEEFPVVFSFFLGVGVYRLAKQHALVRKAVSVENIGRVTQICTDKTGTITLGQLTLNHLDIANDLIEEEVVTVALAASNMEGSDPVDVALFDLAKKREVVAPRRFNVIPFTENRKRETAFFKRHDSIICAIKGSPETVLSKSNLSRDELEEWRNKVSNWAKNGHKVLAVASIEVSEDSANSCYEPEVGFKFQGLLVFEDPARPEIKEAIKYCHENAIKVLMITGDHPDTASAIAKDVGLIESSAVVISAEEEPFKLEEKWLTKYPDFFKSVDIVARCNPIQKLKIVESLKKIGELVVVTGDGVNDVPALKAADIGISMGLRGTRSAKEVSSIILTDDNFSTIVNAIREGKQLFENLRMSFKYLLLFHIPFVLSAAIIPLMGHPLLYLPIHVVWLELIIHPTALFAFQQFAQEKERNDLSQSNSFFNKKETVAILTIGISLTAIIILSFIAGVSENQNIEHGRAKVMTILSFWSAGLVMVLTKGKTLTAKLLMIITILSSVILIQTKIFSQALHLTPLHILDWVKVFAIILAFLIILDLSNRKKNRGVNTYLEK